MVLSCNMDKSSLHLRRPPIVGLLFRCGPSAILRRVVAVVVDSIQRSVGWTRAHVAIEGFERSAPAGANRDSSASVGLELMKVRVLAALDHAFPTVILAALPHPMCTMGPAIPFGSVAAARHGGAASQKRPQDGFFFSAIAAANPFSRIGLRKSRNSHETPKSLVGQVDQFPRHACHFTVNGVN